MKTQAQRTRELTANLQVARALPLDDQDITTFASYVQEEAREVVEAAEALLHEAVTVEALNHLLYEMVDVIGWIEAAMIHNYKTLERSCKMKIQLADSTLDAMAEHAHTQEQRGRKRLDATYEFLRTLVMEGLQFGNHTTAILVRHNEKGTSDGAADTDERSTD